MEEKMETPYLEGLEKIVGNVMWSVRSLRCRHAELTPETVYQHQRYIFRYSLAQVSAALRIIEHRGFYWNHYFDLIPDACIPIKGHPGAPLYV